MTNECAQNLLSLGPVIEALFRAEYSGDYWHLWMRHRHANGLFTDCPAVTFERLTRSELQDVLDVTVEMYGPLGDSSDHSEYFEDSF